MRADNFEFDPKFKLLIAGNHKPRLKNVDEAIRRRFYLIPFTIDIPKEERDEHLKENLQAEGAGILAWMVEGCLAWQREGLNAPASVVAATEEYLQGEDAILTWLSERCVRDANARVEADQLFGSWAVWAKVAGEPIGTKKEFYGAMRQHKFEDKRDNKGKRHFHGLDVIPIEAFKPDGARTAPEMFANVVPFSPRPAAPSGLAPTADGTLPPPPY
jgi:putative DNA primase/helicase